MPTPPSTRSIRISDDERGGWSSDRPRSGPARPADISVRSRVLKPSERLRYSPGSLVIVVSASPDERDRFVTRLIEDRSSLLSLEKVRGLLGGRVPDEEIDSRAVELLDAAVLKRLTAGDTVVVPVESLDPAERERFVRPAAGLRRPRHLILLDTGRDQVAEEDRLALNELRRALDAGELGNEGFQTVLRLGGAAAGEVKRIVFQPAPRAE